MEDFDRAQRRQRLLVRRNFIFTTAEGLFTNAAFGLTAPFIPIYVLAVGGTSFHVSLVTALPPLVTAAAFLIGVRVVDRLPQRLHFIIRWAFLHRVVYLAMALVALIPLWRPDLLVALTTLQALPGALSGLAWTAMMGDIFPQNRRGELIGLRNMYTGITGLFTTFLAGILLDHLRLPLNYLVVFAAAFVLSMAGLHFMNQMREEPGAVGPKTATNIPILEHWRRLAGDTTYGRNFRYFIFSSALLWLAFGYTGPIWPIYHVKVLHLSNVVIGSFSVLAGLAGVLTSGLWGRLAARRGERIVLFIGVGGLTLFTATYMLSPSPAYLMFSQALGGAWTAALNLAVFNLALNYCVPSERAAAVAWFNAIINLAAFVGPFLGELWYVHFGVASTFYSGTVIRALALLVVWRLIRPGFLNVRYLAGVSSRLIRDAQSRLPF